MRRPSLQGLLLAAVPVAVGAWMAAARWTSHGPFGSDNDEYRLLADSLWHGSVRIAGVEGTKYPIGYSFLLGLLDRLGLPMTGTAILLNLVALGVLGVLVWRLAVARGAVAAGAVAATVLVLSVSMWDAVLTTMPDVLFVLVCTAVLALVPRLGDRRALVAALALVAVASLLKSVGLLLGLALSVHLLARRTSWRVALAPLGIALLLGGAQAAWSGTEPDHTTGYAHTFWLADPFDASQGSIGVLDLPERAAARIGDVLRDVRGAALGPQHRDATAMAVAGLLVLAGLVALRDRWTFTVPFVLADLAFLSIWPYPSPRFGLPLLPYAAVGAGALLGVGSRALGRLLGARAGLVGGAAVAAVLLVPYALDAHAEASRRGRATDKRDAAAEAAIDRLSVWMDANLPPDAVLASTFYRELAYRTDRTYRPVPYSLEQLDLVRAIGDVDAVVVITGHNPGRDRVQHVLVSGSDLTMDLEQCFSDGPVVVYTLVVCTAEDAQG